MNKLQPSIIALSCIMALSACSSSSKGGTDNSEQIRQTEIELNQKIAEANKKAEAAVKKAEEAAKANSQKQTESDKKAEEATQTEKPQSQQTDTEKNAAQEALKKAEEAAKAALANNQKTEAEKNAAQEALKKAEEAAKAAQASSQKTEAEKKAAQEALKKAEEAAKAALANNQKTEAEKNAAQEALKKAEEAAKAAQASSQKTEAEKKAAEDARKAAEERLKKLENLQADEKARIPLSDNLFGGVSGEMKDRISGGVLTGEKNEASRPLARDVSDLAVIDGSGRTVDIPVVRTANIDPDGIDDEYRDPYHMVKEGNSILSNSDFKSSAFGTYFYNLTDKQYFYAQGNPTVLAQIPTAGKVEYDGGAAYKKDGDNSQRTGMTATADFANKVIDINIKKSRFVPDMKFGGKITGNSFAGEVNGIKTQGGFFGENAQEMGGLFTNEADQSRGAFGGIKQ